MAKKVQISCAHFALWNFDHYYYQSLPCKKWTCPICSKKKYKEIRKRMNRSEANNWVNKTHIIITLKDHRDNNILFPALNDFMTFLRRGGTFIYTTVRGETRTIETEPQQNLHFIWSLEVQHDRFMIYEEIAWHLHIIINKRINKYKIFPIFNHALRLHGSESKFNYVETRHPHNLHAGEYLSKYFTKEEAQILLEKGSESYKRKRRWSCSRYKDNTGKWHSIVPPLEKIKNNEKWIFMWIDDARQLLQIYEADPENFIPETAYIFEFKKKPKIKLF